jgi:hypothetical protein
VGQQLEKHEKIRFRREEIKDLGAFPSAVGVGRARRGLLRRAMRVVVAGFAVAATLAGLLAGMVFLIGVSGLGTERLRMQAESAIESIAGSDVSLAMGPTGILLDGPRLLALDMRDVSVKAADGASLVDAGQVRFGLRFLSLLSGDLQLGSARISDARIAVAAMPLPDRGDWTTVLKNGEGLVDPDKLAAFIFGQVHRFLDALEAGSTRRIELENVEFSLPEDGQLRLISIVSAELSESGPGTLGLAAQVKVDGRMVEVSATASRDVVSRRITQLDMTIAAPAPEPVAGDAGDSDGNSSQIGAFDLSISGREGIGEDADRLTAALHLKNATLDLGKEGMLSGSLELDASLVEGANKIEFDRLRVVTGRTDLEFNGAIGPKPPTGVAGEKPVYRYELITTRTTLAPVGSPEPALAFLARIRGTYDAEASLLKAEDIAIKSGQGEALGRASLEFSPGAAPGIMLALNVHDMPVSHAKQLWPWFAANGARKWVLEHLFGGRVLDGEIHFQVGPARLGNGVPLSAAEVSGRFEVDDTRFDTAGLIPPVRDAVGVIEFHGNDVDVSLSTGTVYMPSGRTVAATRGTLRIEHANRPPLIGILDMDVVGDADAITELASYEPINAMRHVGLKPEHFSGQVSGNVKAQIPLQKGIDTDRLTWRVALDYKGLALTEALDGQKLSDADGTIVVEPGQAQINAKGRLNGVPAEISMVEPLRQGGPARQQKVQLVLDDAARKKVAPGLGSLVSGTIRVDLDATGKGERSITADLTGATLDIPWIGWSKGPGVGAKVSFKLKTADGVSTLSDFLLEGQSFAIAGSLTLADGNLASARFTKVRLNRGDDVAVSIERKGKSYAIKVNGSAFDARSLVKKLTSTAGSGGNTSDTAVVSLGLDVDSVTGFGSEKLSGVKLNYSGTGARLGGLDATATLGSGAAISVRSTREAGQRGLQMQSADAGAILRFLNIYEHMEGGVIKLALAAQGDGPMRGQVDARNFWLVDEPKLASIVSTTPPGDQRSLNQAVKRDIDTSRVQFERGAARLEKGDGYLKIENGVLRGPLIGTTFQGTLYDPDGNMAMTGTFMPAYGLNRLFGELPLVGMILGNGRDRGLIGVTYKLSGKAKSPTLQINPLSVIAPGIFRSIFEFQ